MLLVCYKNLIAVVGVVVVYPLVALNMYMKTQKMYYMDLIWREVLGLRRGRVGATIRRWGVGTEGRRPLPRRWAVANDPPSAFAGVGTARWHGAVGGSGCVSQRS